MTPVTRAVSGRALALPAGRLPQAGTGLALVPRGWPVPLPGEGVPDGGAREGVWAARCRARRGGFSGVGAVRPRGPCSSAPDSARSHGVKIKLTAGNCFFFFFLSFFLKLNREEIETDPHCFFLFSRMVSDL